MGVADIARQHATAGSGADGFRMHQQRWGAQRHGALRLIDLSLYPARRLVRPPLRLLLGIGHPRIGVLATAPVDRDGEGAELGDVVVAALGWLVAQGQIGFAPHEVRRCSWSNSNVMPEGNGVVVAPDRQRARKPAAHSPVDTRTVPINAGEAAARRRSSVSMACSALSATGTSRSPTALRCAPSGSRSNRARTAERRLELGQSAGDGRLAQPERTPRGTQ